MRKFLLPVVQAILLITTFLVSSNSKAQPVLGFNSFITGLSSPVDITNAGDGTNRLFIVQQGGQIRLWNGTLQVTPFLDISTIITSGGERGLLSLAFHPDYETNRYFFVYYTNLSGDITIARYQTQAGDPTLADPLSGVVLLNIPKPFANHNGGDLNFGPDGYLYFGTGDGGSGGDPNNFAQNGLSLLGKMLRIDVNDFLTPPYYTVPLDNPYLADPTVDDRIWAIGLRNPWRWSFDRLTNDMWIADVGQGSWEEINFRPAGTTGGINYGWRCYEGNHAYNTAGCLPQASYIAAIFEYPHDFATGGFSVTGGFVYRGAEYPVLQGYYICADYVSGNVWMINPDGGGGWITRRQAGLAGNISGFGEAENATLYAVSLNGTVYKVDVTVVLPVTLLSFSGKGQTGFNDLKWVIGSSQNTSRFIIEYSTPSSGWLYAGEVAAINQGDVQQYAFRHYTTETGKILYRLQIEDIDGTTRYSPIVAINSGESERIKVFPTVINTGVMQVVADKEVISLNIVDASGRIVLSKQMGRLQGYFTVALPKLNHGMYWVQFVTNAGTETAKIIIE